MYDHINGLTQEQQDEIRMLEEKGLEHAKVLMRINYKDMRLNRCNDVIKTTDFEEAKRILISFTKHCELDVEFQYFEKERMKTEMYRSFTKFASSGDHAHSLLENLILEELNKRAEELKQEGDNKEAEKYKKVLEDPIWILKNITNNIQYSEASRMIILLMLPTGKMKEAIYKAVIEEPLIKLPKEDYVPLSKIDRFLNFFLKK